MLIYQEKEINSLYILSNSVIDLLLGFILVSKKFSVILLLIDAISLW